MFTVTFPHGTFNLTRRIKAIMTTKCVKIISKLNKIMFKIKSEYSKNLLYEKVNIVNIYQATIYIRLMKSSVYSIKKI